MITRRREWWLLGAITALAVAARFIHIQSLPPGLHFDEAFEAVQALDILHGRGYPVFFAGNYGVEPILIYLIAGFFRLFGVTPMAGRLVAAMVGALTVPALHLLVRTVFRERGDDDRRAVVLGLASALTLSVLYWHVHFSRLGVEPILVPLNVILALYFLWRALTTRRLWAFVACGACVGFGPYTYPAARLLPVLVALVATHWLLTTTPVSPRSDDFSRSRPPTGATDPRNGSGAGVATTPTSPGRSSSDACPRSVSGVSRWFLGFAALIVAAVIVFAPLGLYFRAHPDLLFQRVSQVGVVGSGQGSQTPLQAIRHNAERTLTMFIWAGDEDPRNNVPGRPVLDPAWAVLFVVGVAVMVVRLRRPEYGLLLWWLVVLSSPTIFSEYAPHFRRALGASPAVAVLLALGAVSMAGFRPRRNSGLTSASSSRNAARIRVGLAPVDADGPTEVRQQARIALVPALALALWLTGAAAGIHAYFTVWAHSSALYYAFDVGIQEIGKYVRALPADEMAYLSPVRQDHQTLIFTVGREDYPKTFDGRRCVVLPPPDHPAAYVNLVAEDTVLPRRLQEYLPDLAEDRRFIDFSGERYAVARRVDTGARQMIAPTIPVHGVLGAVVEVLGVDVPPKPVRSGQPLIVRVYWRALAPMSEDYTAFVHLVGPFNPAKGGPLWAQQDAQPGQGSYPTRRWTPGETIIEDYRLEIPAGAPAGDYTVHVGLYLLATLSRLPVSQDARLWGDSLPVATIRLAP